MKRKRQFSLRAIFCVTTAVAILSAGWSLAERKTTERAHIEKLHRAQLQRQRERALIEWHSRENPCSWDFGDSTRP